jgi:hypothetical protein
MTRAVNRTHTKMVPKNAHKHTKIRLYTHTDLLHVTVTFRDIKHKGCIYRLCMKLAYGFLNDICVCMCVWCVCVVCVVCVCVVCVCVVWVCGVYVCGVGVCVCGVGVWCVCVWCGCV